MARKRREKLPRHDQRPLPLPIKEEEGGGHYTLWTVPPTHRLKVKEPQYIEDADMGSSNVDDNPAIEEE